MDWVYQFWPVFVFPVGFCTILFGGAYWSDNGSYPWKHWTREQTVGAFAIGPAIGLFLVGTRMIDALIGQPVVFERWFTAVSFLVFSIHLLYYRCNKFFEVRNEEEREKIRAEWEAAHPRCRI